MMRFGIKAKRTPVLNAQSLELGAELIERGARQDLEGSFSEALRLPVKAKILFALTHFSASDQLLFRLTQRLEGSVSLSSNRLESLKTWQRFFSGANNTIDYVWNPAFLALFLYDVIHYAEDPAGHYGKKPIDFLLGMSPRDTFLTAAMTESLPAPIHLFRPLLLLIAPLLIGLAEALSSKQWLVRSELTNDEVTVLFDKSQDFTSRQAAVDRIIGVAGERYGLQRFYAAAALYRMLVAALAELPSDLVQDSQNPQYHLVTSLETALLNLKKDGGLNGFYADYLLWLRQKPQHHRSAWFYLPVPVLRNALRLRYGLALLWALKIGVEHLASWKACDQTWQYVNELNEYICAVCPDWQTVVNSALLHDSVACLTEYLMQPALTASMICSAIERMQDQFAEGSTLNLDFTSQVWLKFPESEWVMLQSCLHQLAAHIQIQQLNISSMSVQPIQQIGHRVAELSVLASETLDLTGQVLSLEATTELYFSEKLQHLWMAKTALQPTQVELLVGRLNATSMRDLDLQGADLSSIHLPALFHGLHLHRLILARCFVSDADLLALLQALDPYALQELDLSHIPLSVNVMTALGELLQHGLEILHLNDAELSDAHLQALSLRLNEDSSLKVLGLAGNAFSEEGFIALGQAILHTSLRQLVLDQCPLDEAAINALFSSLPGSLLTELSLQNIYLTAGGLLSLAQSFPETRLERLDLSHNALDGVSLVQLANATVLPRNVSQLSLVLENTDLDDTTFIALSEQWQHFNGSFTLHVGANHLTDVSQSAIATLITSGIHGLSLAGNALTDGACRVFSEVLPNSQLATFDLAENTLGQRCAGYLAQAWPLSALQAMSLRGNPMGDHGALALAEHLSDMPHAEFLSSTHPSGDWLSFFHQEATPLKQALALDLRDTLMGSAGMIASCRIFTLFRQHEQPLALDFDAGISSSVNPITCAVSSASMINPSMVLMALLFVWLISHFAPSLESTPKQRCHY